MNVAKGKKNPNRFLMEPEGCIVTDGTKVKKDAPTLDSVHVPNAGGKSNRGKKKRPGAIMFDQLSPEAVASKDRDMKVAKYNPDEARDGRGRWSGVGRMLALKAAGRAHDAEMMALSSTKTANQKGGQNGFKHTVAAEAHTEAATAHSRAAHEYSVEGQSEFANAHGLKAAWHQKIATSHAKAAVHGGKVSLRKAVALFDEIAKDMVNRPLSTDKSPSETKNPTEPEAQTASLKANAKTISMAGKRGGKRMQMHLNAAQAHMTAGGMHAKLGNWRMADHHGAMARKHTDLAAAYVKKIAERNDVDPKEGKKKYGNVEYADPKNKKYPLDAKHIHAALSYWGQESNRAKYSAEDQKTIGARIRAAAKRHGIKVSKEWEVLADYEVSCTWQIAKMDEEQQIMYGWASVDAVNGHELQDLQGDVISLDELQKAAHNFMMNSRNGDVRHDEVAKGVVVESMILSPDIKKQLKINDPRTGWFIGYKVTDPTLWQDCKAGKYPAFSIGGTGVRIPEE